MNRSAWLRVALPLTPLCFAVCPTGFAQESPATRPVAGEPVVARIEADKTRAPISPFLYGMFIEHARNLVYRGLWSEMIDDRKFYYPIVPAPTTTRVEPLPTTQAQSPLRRPRNPAAISRRWVPVGEVASITMDKEHPYVGDQSPVIKLSQTEPSGFEQEGVNLTSTQGYKGRIVLAGDASAKVTVSLMWGSEPGDRQEVTIEHLGNDFATYPIEFKAVQKSVARIRIAAVGSGMVRVGAVSLMPADNIRGWRAEVVAVLKSLHSGLYRWPGGNFVSAFDWRDAIGDPDKRPPMLDPVWNTLQSNDVGTDEFMDLCRQVEVEPYITVNSGLGDARSAAEYVEYANGPVTTRMGAMRAANGHPEPYHVKYWNIGNEMWGDYQYGYMPLEQYEFKHNLFAKLMRKVDPSIVLIASGAMPDTMTGAKQSLKLGDKLIPDYLGPADWTGNLFEHCLENMDMISEHFYNYGNTHLDLASNKQVPNDPNEPLSDWMRRPANHVRLKYEEYQQYLSRLPKLRAKPVPIALDEYAYTGGNYKVVPAYAWNFHEMFRHSDVYQLATLTFVTATFDGSDGHAALNATGKLFKMYRDAFGTIPVEVDGDSPQPAPKAPPGGEQPAVNAGSDTFPLDVSAAWSEDHRYLAVAVINPTEQLQSLKLRLNHANLAGGGTLYRMAPQSLTATGSEVQVEQSAVADTPSQVQLPPFSVSIYQLKAQQ